jgi:hypothetical protein
MGCSYTARPRSGTSSAEWRNCGFRWDSAWSSTRCTGTWNTAVRSNIAGFSTVEREWEQLGVSATSEIPFPFSGGEAIRGCGRGVGHHHRAERDHSNQVRPRWCLQLRRCARTRRWDSWWERAWISMHFPAHFARDTLHAVGLGADQRNAGHDRLVALEFKSGGVSGWVHVLRAPDGNAPWACGRNQR